MPQEVAAEYVCAEYPDEEAVLRAVQHMAVSEIATEPGVRNYIREKCRDIL